MGKRWRNTLWNYKEEICVTIVTIPICLAAIWNYQFSTFLLSVEAIVVTLVLMYQETTRELEKQDKE